MTEENKDSFFRGVDLHTTINNLEHHTIELSEDNLIVRRGQRFILTFKMIQSYDLDLHPFNFCAVTGDHPSEDQGTMSNFSVPGGIPPSPSAKAVWKVQRDESSSSTLGILNLSIIPPADAPIGEYNLCVTHRDEKANLGKIVVLFNAWCPDDWVFLDNEKKRQEYVMTEQGLIYKGSANYIFPCDWDYGQFESAMLDIGIKILDLNPKHERDPADDVSARCNPIYVGRVVSAMINSQDDRGVLEGCWGGSYADGVSPSHWSGSYNILKKWFDNDCHAVKYGQCWVFAGVMCSVMRLLGIPCRVITNFNSAHDNNKNLTIDVYHAGHGVKEKESHDSVWNFHVWVEGWMRRPDLEKGKEFDGWQVLDPTPQEMSEGVYCCGPAPVKAILSGDVHFKYDIPFVFAEVNADCIDWLVKADNSLVEICSDTKRVGKNISTKAVGGYNRVDVTQYYKHKEGSKEERAVFKYAITRDYAKHDVIRGTEEAGENEVTEEAGENEVTEGSEFVNEDTRPIDVPTPNIPPVSVSIEIKEVSKPVNGKDVSLNLVLQSDNTVVMPLSINISVQAMKYNGSPAANIQSEVTEKTLQPGKDLSIPILVPFLTYYKPMLECDSMKVSVVATDKKYPDRAYLAEDDIVLQDPPFSITITSPTRLNRQATGELVFRNPVDLTLENCTVTFSGSGIWKEDTTYALTELKPCNRMMMKFAFIPYKTGKRTIVADFDCSVFRDIKAKCTVNVRL